MEDSRPSSGDDGPVRGDPDQWLAGRFRPRRGALGVDPRPADTSPSRTCPRRSPPTGCMCGSPNFTAVLSDRQLRLPAMARDGPRPPRFDHGPPPLPMNPLDDALASRPPGIVPVGLRRGKPWLRGLRAGPERRITGGMYRGALAPRPCRAIRAPGGGIKGPGLPHRASAGLSTRRRTSRGRGHPAARADRGRQGFGIGAASRSRPGHAPWPRPRPRLRVRPRASWGLRADGLVA